MFANNIYTEVFKVGNFNIDQFSYIAKTLIPTGRKQ